MHTHDICIHGTHDNTHRQTHTLASAHIYTLQTVNEMENQNRNNALLYNQVQERSFQLRREERRSRTFEGIQPRQLSFEPDTLDNCCVVGTRVANMLDEIRDGMEGL